MDDQQVIAAVLAGDVNCYEVLVERYQKPIFNLMQRMTGSYADALDLAQETFIKAYEKLDRFRMGERFFPWLYAIGLNHAKNFLRRNKQVELSVNESLDQESGLDYAGQQEEWLCARLDHERLQQALTQLPMDYREALVLRYHEELSMEEIAVALRISISGAKMRVHRGLDKLRQILVKDYHGRD